MNTEKEFLPEPFAKAQEVQDARKEEWITAVGGQCVAEPDEICAGEAAVGAGATPDNGEKDTVAACQNTVVEHAGQSEREIYESIVRSDRFRAFYAQDMQRLINRRFREKREEREKAERAQALLSKVVSLVGADSQETLAGRLETVANASEIIGIYADAGDKAGTVAAQAALLGCSPLALYRAFHPDLAEREISDRVRVQIAKQMADHVRAGHLRATENGTLQNAGAAGCVGGRLTREERARIAARAANGECITL